MNNTMVSCANNSDSFNIVIGGNDHVMTLDANTQFTILHGWFDEGINSFVIDAVENNNKEIAVELSFPCYD